MHLPTLPTRSLRHECRDLRTMPLPSYLIVQSPIVALGASVALKMHP